MVKYKYNFQPGYAEKRTRNLEILAQKTAGATYFQLAKKYRLHPNRIYQIVKSYREKIKKNPELLNEYEQQKNSRED